MKSSKRHDFQTNLDEAIQNSPFILFIHLEIGISRYFLPRHPRGDKLIKERQKLLKYKVIVTFMCL